jgi:hypothetical protein
MKVTRQRWQRRKNCPHKREFGIPFEAREREREREGERERERNCQIEAERRRKEEEQRERGLKRDHQLRTTT